MPVTKKTTKRKIPKNKFELRLDKQLFLSGVEYGYEQDKLPYILSYNYNPDFTITSPSGHTIYIEAKGYFRPEHKAKMAAVKKLHPDKDIRLVFYSRNKTYIKWAEKHNFPWAIGSIPEEWLQ